MKKTYPEIERPDPAAGAINRTGGVTRRWAYQLRSLHTAHRRLAEMLLPGMKILDVGCASGAITRGIALAVGPTGCVVGVDADANLIEQARRTHVGVPGLSFEVGDAYSLRFEKTFDIVTSARVLHLLTRPRDAVAQMAEAVKPGERVVILDFSHEKTAWEPPLPGKAQEFRTAKLRWRAASGMDIALADHLAAMFAEIGLEDIRETPQHELIRREDPNFFTNMNIAADLMFRRGQQMVKDGFITDDQLLQAEAEHRKWIREQAEMHSWYLLAVDGERPR